MYQKAADIINEVKKAVVGKDAVISKALMAVIAGGHILLEDRPGVGKTTMALAFSKAVHLDYRRIQFTPEVMPADVVGFTIYNQAENRLDYQPGAVLCNLFLADEINRTSSKTQSALLPESQLDRFLVRLSMGYPSLQEEILILKARQGQNLMDTVRQVADGNDILEMQREAEQVYVADELYQYMARLTGATRNHELIKSGISPRGTLALARMSRAAAWISGRDYVVPGDVQSVYFDVLEHRLIPGAQAKLVSMDAHGILEQILRAIPAPGLRR